MKIKTTVSALLLSLFLNGYSQQAQSLDISLEEPLDIKDPKQLKLIINTGPSLAEGMFINLPSQIKPAIRSIKLDGNELWLINSQAVVEKENVIGWFIKDNGVVLHYNEGLNGELTIQMVFDIVQFNKAKETQVTVYGINRVDQEIVIENTTFAQSDISNIQNSQPDEN